jgi:hypothetical protein
MFLAYQLTRILGLVFGVVLGVVITFLGLGWGGGIIGPLLGIAVGLLGSQLPPEIVRHSLLLWMRCRSTDGLRAWLQQEPGLAPMILEVLVARGEPVDSFRDPVQALLQSTSGVHRGIGRSLSRRWFPDLLKPGPSSSRAAAS